MKRRDGISMKKEDVEMEIEVGSDSIDCSAIYYVVSDVLAFLLFMHHQIPSYAFSLSNPLCLGNLFVLHDKLLGLTIPRDMTHEYCLLQAEYDELEMVLNQQELNIASRRKHSGRKREIRSGIRRVEKFMTAVSNIQTALQLIIREVPRIEAVIFIFGNPRRPRYIFEICFPQGTMFPQTSEYIGKKSCFADRLSRKVIREFTSKGVGSSCNTGPSKLFLLIKASSSFNNPQHFLPKRDFQYSKMREVCTFNNLPIFGLFILCCSLLYLREKEKLFCQFGIIKLKQRNFLMEMIL
ncbi:hypothetical protein V2J09_009222 [Rumex salicifolius]